MTPTQQTSISPRLVFPDFLLISTPLVNLLIKLKTTTSSSKMQPLDVLSVHGSLARGTTDKSKVSVQIPNTILLWELQVHSEKAQNKHFPPTHHHEVSLMRGFHTEIKMVPDLNGTQFQVLTNTKLLTLILVSFKIFSQKLSPKKNSKIFKNF